MRVAIVACLVLLAAPARAESGQSGVWTYTYEPSSGGSGGIVTALSPSPGADSNDPSYLIARCLGGRAELLVGGAGGWGMPHRKLEVTTAIDDAPPETAPWDVSTNGKAVFLDDDVETFLKKLPDDGRLRISIKDGTGASRENIFATRGFGLVRDKIAEACGWAK